jgi:hypothetical protein
MHINRRFAALATVLAVAGSIAPASAGGDRKIQVSDAGGLGRVEVRGKTAVVLRRDEGIVTLIDLRNGKEIGSYSDGATRSLDGDVVFSESGDYIFYARQTEQFSRDGLHVLDVSDPSAVSLSAYHPMGGAYRVGAYFDGQTEWVFVLDATHGLVVFRFEPTTGQVVPVAVDALPALKVGGPASAGIHIDPKDPITGSPLMYVTTGETGLQVYDITNPVAPQVVGEWSDVGLAELEVVANGKSRTVYAATEYWFDASLEPEIVMLDATDLGAISEHHRFDAGGEADPTNKERIQGMALAPGRLLVAHSTLGLISFARSGRIIGKVDLQEGPTPGPKAASLGSPYAMDVEWSGGYALVTDAASGQMTLVPRSAL